MSAEQCGHLFMSRKCDCLLNLFVTVSLNRLTVLLILAPVRSVTNTLNILSEHDIARINTAINLRNKDADKTALPLVYTAIVDDPNKK